MSPTNHTELVFVFADLAGFTALTDAHGDMDAAHVAIRFAEIARSILAPGVTLVKSVGDQVMLAAQDAASAVRTATSLRNAVDHEPFFPSVRMGIHGGAIVEHEGDYFGAAVNLAARVADYARSGQILCTRWVVTAIGPQALGPVQFQALETVQLKNLATPVSLFELITERTTVDPVDPVCRMTVQRDTAPAQLLFEGRVYYFCSVECARLFAERPDYYAGT